MPNLKSLIKAVFFKSQRYFCQEVLILGDSHARIFGNFNVRLRCIRCYLNVVAVHGATISGLENVNSKTQSHAIYAEAIRTTRANRVFVLLGENDLGFSIWLRSEREGQVIEETLLRTLDVYKRFLVDLKNRDFQVTCVSAPLPTIDDTIGEGAVREARKNVKASQRQRTDLTLQFNQCMAEFCAESAIDYLNLDPACLGSDRLVSKEFLCDDLGDHHYRTDAYAQLIGDNLERFLQS